MFKNKACEILKTKELTSVNDCFEYERNAVIGHYRQTLVSFHFYLLKYPSSLFHVAGRKNPEKRRKKLRDIPILYIFAGKLYNMAEEITYVEAYNELQDIVKQLENTSVNVDELSEKIKRAHQLLQICQQKLSSVEEDVDEIIKELNS